MDATGLGVSGVDVTTAAGALTVTTTGAISDEQGTATAGNVAIGGDYTGATFATQFEALKGSVSYNGKTFDLSTVDYTGDTTAADRLASVNAASTAALGAGTWTASGTALTFTGAAPAATGSTAADAAQLSPVFAQASGASEAIDLLDEAIKTVSTTRADLGAIQNRFDHTINNLNVAVENLTASESRIRDADMAQEMVQFTRNQILSQAGTAMLAQANQASQGVLSLLR
jgi:flagellin